MLLRAFVVSCVIVFGGSLPGFAQQQQTGPATLENLLNPEEAQKAGDAPAAEATDTGPQRPSGTLIRPVAGIKHPELDKAWAEYDAVVAKAAATLREAMVEQRQTARASGDLAAAKRSKDMLNAFDKKGELPRDDKAIAKQVGTAENAFQSAAANLQKVYKAVVVAMVKDTTIDEAEAEAVENERKAIFSGSAPIPQPKNGDLLATTQLPRDAMSGQWERVANGIVVHNDGNGNGSRLCFPVELPKEYEVKISFTRNWGNNGFGLYATRGDAAFLIQLSAVDGQWAALNEIKGGPPCKVRSPNLGNAQHQLVVAVRDEGVSAWCDGRLLFKQATDDTNVVPDRYGFGANRLGLISWFNDVTFHKVELRTLSR